MAKNENCNGKGKCRILLSKPKHEESDSLSSSIDGDPGERQTWSSKTEFILSMVGYCVGLGNIWRFPYVCMKNGGGAFLIPFLLSLVLCGMPVFFLESALGQFLGKSSWHTWSICPLLKGIGISMNLSSIICSFYYSMILGWSLIYLVNSFKSPLPWTLCGQFWNSPDCLIPQRSANASDILGNQTTVGVEMANETNYNDTSSFVNAFVKISTENGVTNATVTSSTEEFWLHNVLELSTGLSDLGGLPWHTTVALFAANVLVLAGIVKGIRTSGKVVYVTATLPYLFLTVILILGLTLPGSGDGILFYIKPDFSKLLTLAPWMEAAIQVFYSLGTGWGAIITMASYNKFNNNCMRDSIVLTLCCEGTSIFGGFAIFSILGHMAYKTGNRISKFAKSGAGLAFVVYPEALSYLPLPQLWGFIFFLMLFLLGLDSMFTTVETTLTVIADMWPVMIKKWRVAISSSVMLGFSVGGLLFACRGGMYWLQLFDWYIAAFTLLIQVSIECVAIAWIYGYDRFSDDIKLMIGRKPMTFFIWAWKFITPIILMVLWLLTLAFYKPPTYEGYKYPPSAEAFGWIIAITPFMAVVLYAVYKLIQYDGSIKVRFQKACIPSPDWGPSLAEVREKYQPVLLYNPDKPHKDIDSNV